MTGAALLGTARGAALGTGGGEGGGEGGGGEGGDEGGGGDCGGEGGACWIEISTWSVATRCWSVARGSMAMSWSVAGRSVHAMLLTAARRAEEDEAEDEDGGSVREVMCGCFGGRYSRGVTDGFTE